jgi:hypothetical protein
MQEIFQDATERIQKLVDAHGEEAVMVAMKKVVSQSGELFRRGMEDMADLARKAVGITETKKRVRTVLLEAPGIQLLTEKNPAAWFGQKVLWPFIKGTGKILGLGAVLGGKGLMKMAGKEIDQDVNIDNQTIDLKTRNQRLEKDAAATAAATDSLEDLLSKTNDLLSNLDISIDYLAGAQTGQSAAEVQGSQDTFAGAAAPPKTKEPEEQERFARPPENPIDK